MSSTTFNVAVIGYGMSAKIFHIPLITAIPTLKLYGIVQRHPKSGDSAAEDHASIKTWTSYESMLEDSAVGVVVVTSPPTSHYEQALAALEAGKHVVVEKPFVPTSSEAHALIAAAKKANKLLTVYQNRRWDQDFLTLQKVLKEGVLGDLAEFETHYDRFRPSLPPPDQLMWKNRNLPAGGVLFDLGSHLLDQVYVLFGKPQGVTAWVGVQKRGLGADECPSDACTVVLDYGAEKRWVTVKSSSLSPEEAQLRFWVRGSKGSFKKFHLDVQEGQLKAGGTIHDKGFGVEPEEQFGTLITADSDGNLKSSTYPSATPTLYLEYYKIFADALAGKGPVPVNPEDAADVLRVIELALESSKNRTTMKF